MNWSKLDSYDYTLRSDLIAKHPVSPRDNARLLFCDPNCYVRADYTIKELPKVLPQNSVIVLNDTRVIPARIRLAGPKHHHEFLVTRRHDDDQYVKEINGLLSNRKKLKIPTQLEWFSKQFLRYDGPVASEPTLARLTPDPPITTVSWNNILDTWGQMPIPPYLNRDYDPQRDPLDYQTVFARRGHSVAAPTAGLHFTKRLLANLLRLGNTVVSITLNVGYGTFRPIRSSCLDDHKMHTEYYQISKPTWDTIRNAKHVVAVGTTTLRALEDFVRLTVPRFDTWCPTDLFIRPGFDFQTATHLLTNFHLPKSSLLCLVYAFGGPSFVKKAYQKAIDSAYRFYSYGDAMLLKRQRSMKV